jgi:hypothetical protein
MAYLTGFQFGVSFRFEPRLGRDVTSYSGLRLTTTLKKETSDEQPKGR